ncbi:hypothetical protein Tco_1318310 [Tanacetum coccineum]
MFLLMRIDSISPFDQVKGPGKWNEGTLVLHVVLKVMFIILMDVKTAFLDGELMRGIYETSLEASSCLAMKIRYTSNPGTQHWQAIQRISNTEDNSSTSGWVFLLGGAISWVSKKQTCITGSTMESKFVALAAAGKEAE